MRSSIRIRLAFAVALLGGAGVSNSIGAQVYHYGAKLESPGGNLEFELVLEKDRDQLKSVTIVNGSEKIAVNDAIWHFPGAFEFGFPHYNSVIKAKHGIDVPILAGTWTKRSGDKIVEMAFRASQIDSGGLANKFRSMPSAAKFAGRWTVTFESSPDPAVAIFEADGGLVVGTFLTTIGDYRYLNGHVESDVLRLSTFDGSHAFLFDAKLTGDDSLAGNFWSGTSWHETWTATRDDQATLPDGFEQLEWKEQPTWSTIKLHNLDGTETNLDPTTAFGELTIVNIFGSWCPNCHDEAPYLVELQNKYGSQGLRIVGLAFEASGEVERDAEQVKRYVRRHAIPFPIFLAGISDKREAALALGFVDQLKAFPTTVFADKAGKILSVYSGFSGPATGVEHDQLKSRFESIIRRNLHLE